MDHHSFLIKSAMGGSRPPLWQLVRELKRTAPKTAGRESGRYALQASSKFKPKPFPASSKESLKATKLPKEAALIKAAVRGMLKSKIRMLPQSAEMTAAIPQATGAVSAAKGYLQSLASANLDPGFLGKLTPQQRDKYLQMILGRGKAQGAMQSVRSVLPALPKDLKGLLM